MYLATTRNTPYSILAYDENDDGTPSAHYIKNIKNRRILVEKIFEIAHNKFKGKLINYEIQYLSCFVHELTDGERKRTMNSHRRKYTYATLAPAQKKQKLENRQTEYKKMPKEKKQSLLDSRKNSYQSMDDSKKDEFLIKNMNYKKTLDEEQKQKQLEYKKARYHALDDLKKEELLVKNITYKKALTESEKKKRLENKSRKYAMDKQDCPNIDVYIEKFKQKIKAGPFYICCVCNRALYKKSLIIIQRSKYTRQNCFVFQTSFDGNHYICKTCHGKLLKNQQPCQSAVNNLFVDETPAELSALQKLEQILIAQRIVFGKIVIMPKGQQRKIKGAICNIPVECDQTCKVLPRPPDRSGIILLKLKKKLQFRGHVYFQAVRPQFVINALNWLIANNPLYKDVQIGCDNISAELIDFNCDLTDQQQSRSQPIPTKKAFDDDKEDEEQDDPLNEHRSAASETCLQSILPNYPIMLENTDCNTSTGNDVFNIAPGEGKHPVSMMTDKLCEELSFPVLFPTGRFGYTAERDVKLSLIKYFNARLLHYSGKFATNPEYLFFAQFIMEQKKVSDSINIALKKVRGQSVTASQVKSNTEAFQNLLFQDQA